MKTNVILFIVILILASCSSPQQKKAATNYDESFATISKNIINVSKTYLASQLTNPEIKTESNGVINIRSTDISYTIYPFDINIGQIDEDSSMDAIVSYFVSAIGKPQLKKHLILLNKGEFKVVRNFPSELKVMWIANKIVYGQVPKIAPDAPGHDCKVCKQEVKYKLVADSLQLVN
jgi:uncharacterized protein YcfL